MQSTEQDRERALREDIERERESERLGRLNASLREHLAELADA